MAQINIKKFTSEITEPYIRTTHDTMVRKARYGYVRAAPFSFHPTLGTSYATVHFFHSAFLPQRSKHRKVFLHIGGTKNIPKWDGTILPQQAAPKQQCCYKVRYKAEELPVAKTAVCNLKSNLGSFHKHHQS